MGWIQTATIAGEMNLNLESRIPRDSSVVKIESVMIGVSVRPSSKVLVDVIEGPDWIDRNKNLETSIGKRPPGRKLVML